MKEDIKDRWVANLTSGEYIQGEGQLRDESGKFCCLGVLCDMAVKDKVILPPVWSDVSEAYVYDNNTWSILPRAVSHWAGLGERHDPFVSLANGDGYTLSELNDGGKDFNTIAEIIKECL